MTEQEIWLVGGTIFGPDGPVKGAIGWRAGRIVAVRTRAPRGARHIDAQGQCVAPGFIDLHVWGPPETLAREAASSGTTGFLTTIGPCAPEQLVSRLVLIRGPKPMTRDSRASEGAQCLGVHLEGPFVNARKAGALPRRWMRYAAAKELRQLDRFRRLIRMTTLAPELPGAINAIRWCAKRGVVASLGHTEADARTALRAVEAGAASVTHVFNAMLRMHHRHPGLLGVALTDPRITAMVILDGAHVDPLAFRLLLRCKGPSGIVLVTDAVRHEANDLRAAPSGGAYRTARGALAGSTLTMMRAVQNAVEFGRIPLWEAIQMASRNPAHLIGERQRGVLEPGKRADLVVFDRQFRASMTFVAGRLVAQRD